MTTELLCTYSCNKNTIFFLIKNTRIYTDTLNTGKYKAHVTAVQNRINGCEKKFYCPNIFFKAHRNFKKKSNHLLITLIVNYGVDCKFAINK
jgi:hypothetical protein